MYQFVITGNTPQELEQNVLDFAVQRVTKDERQKLGPLVQTSYPLERLAIPKTPPPFFDRPSMPQSFAPPVSGPLSDFNPIRDLEVHSTPVNQVNPPPIATSGGVQVDSRGFTWNEKIHASSKSFNKDNTWRYRRGVGNEEIDQVEREMVPQLRSAQQSDLSGALQASAVPTFPSPPSPTVAVEMPYQNSVVANQQVRQDMSGNIGQIAGYPGQTQAMVGPDMGNSATVIPQSTPIAPEIIPPSQISATTQQVSGAYEIAQVPQDVRPAHSYSTFKKNLTLVIADLIQRGKINQEYIAELNNYFGTKDIWNVLGSEKQCMELFDLFGKYGFITVIEG